MKKNIILFGAGKSSTCLIKYLIKECKMNGWYLTVADSNLLVAQSKVGESTNAKAINIQVEDGFQRTPLIKEADIIISLLPSSLHFLVAIDCLEYSKPLLTASYLDEQIAGLSSEILHKGILFLYEMGLDPGIDHMSAMKLINHIKNLGATITSFQSHCGGLIAPESDNNPWHYKISWNPRNVVLAGKSGAVFRENNKVLQKKYHELFEDCKVVTIRDVGRFASYPNRDSLSYIPIYKLENASTFIRTTLRYPDFCKGWSSIVKAGLTNESDHIDHPGLTFKKWAQPILPFVEEDIKKQLEFLGLFDELNVPDTLKSSADILQYLLETKLMMHISDKDMIVMLHEITFELNGKKHKTESSLFVKGHDSMDTAMAKTVGLPLGIAAKLILQGDISTKGLHIPILPEVYEPVLKELETEGIIFHEHNDT